LFDVFCVNCWIVEQFVILTGCTIISSGNEEYHDCTCQMIQIMALNRDQTTCQITRSSFSRLLFFNGILIIAFFIFFMMLSIILILIFILLFLTAIAWFLWQYIIRQQVILLFSINLLLEVWFCKIMLFEFHVGAHLRWILIRWSICLILILFWFKLLVFYYLYRWCFHSFTFKFDIFIITITIKAINHFFFNSNMSICILRFPRYLIDAFVLFLFHGFKHI